MSSDSMLASERQEKTTLTAFRITAADTAYLDGIAGEVIEVTRPALEAYGIRVRSNRSAALRQVLREHANLTHRPWPTPSTNGGGS